MNSVIATDIVDKQLSEVRRKRWEEVFSKQENAVTPLLTQDQPDRVATMVIEHLVQASDVAHTMQHWHVFVKWNEKLFHEMYKAYLFGRASEDPSKNWYQGELNFFDFYVIPLAKKLVECGLFGPDADELVNYAEENRSEWETRGKNLVDKFLESARKKFGGERKVAVHFS